MLSYGGRDRANYGLLLHQLREGQVTKLAFVRPDGATWPLPLYDLALSTAADCAAHSRADVQLNLITPERQPLEIFGTTVSSAVRLLLDEAAVTLHTSSTAAPSRPGWLDIAPGDPGIGVPCRRHVSGNVTPAAPEGAAPRTQRPTAMTPTTIIRGNSMAEDNHVAKGSSLLRVG